MAIRSFNAYGSALTDQLFDREFITTVTGTAVSGAGIGTAATPGIGTAIGGGAGLVAGIGIALAMKKDLLTCGPNLTVNPATGVIRDGKAAFQANRYYDSQREAAYCVAEWPAVEIWQAYVRGEPGMGVDDGRINWDDPRNDACMRCLIESKCLLGNDTPGGQVQRGMQKHLAKKEALAAQGVKWTPDNSYWRLDGSCVPGRGCPPKPGASGGASSGAMGSLMASVGGVGPAFVGAGALALLGFLLLRKA